MSSNSVNKKLSFSIDQILNNNHQHQPHHHQLHHDHDRSSSVNFICASDSGELVHGSQSNHSQGTYSKRSKAIACEWRILCWSFDLCPIGWPINHIWKQFSDHAQLNWFDKKKNEEFNLKTFVKGEQAGDFGSQLGARINVIRFVFLKFWI